MTGIPGALVDLCYSATLCFSDQVKLQEGLYLWLGVRFLQKGYTCQCWPTMNQTRKIFPKEKKAGLSIVRNCCCSSCQESSRFFDLWSNPNMLCGQTGNWNNLAEVHQWKPSQDDSDSSRFESNEIIQIGSFTGIIIRLTPRDLQKSSYTIGTSTYSPVSFCFLWVYVVTWQCKPVAPIGWLGICVTCYLQSESRALSHQDDKGPRKL